MRGLLFRILVLPGILAGLLSATAGCDHSDAQPTWGEPVGVRIADPNDSASGTMLEGAFAVPVGQSPDPYVPAVARLIYGAAKACPSLVALAKQGGSMRIAATIEGGTLHVDSKGAANADEQCVRTSMEKQHVLEAKDPPLKFMLKIALLQSAQR